MMTAVLHANLYCWPISPYPPNTIYYNMIARMHLGLIMISLWVTHPYMTITSARNIDFNSIIIIICRVHSLACPMNTHLLRVGARTYDPQQPKNDVYFDTMN